MTANHQAELITTRPRNIMTHDGHEHHAHET